MLDTQAEEGVGPARSAGAPKATGQGVRWSTAKKAVVLDHLAATGDVNAAAGAAGMSTASVHLLRRRDPAFAAGWSEALAAAYEMLETHLIGKALSGDGIDVALAVKLLGLHRHRIAGKPSGAGMRQKTVTAAETNAALLKRLRVVEARRGDRDRPLALPRPVVIDAGRARTVDDRSSDEG